MSINETFERILDEYEHARQHEPFGKAHPLWDVFDGLAADFRASPPVAGRPDLKVDWTVGKGNWAKVPWVAFLHSKETDTTQSGVYVVYLFRANLSGFYLTFNQGVTRPKNQHGVKEGRRVLRKRGASLARFCEGLEAAGFRVDENIDLRVGSGLGRDYEHSTVAYKRYDRGAVPEDEQLLSDLEAVLSAYDAYLEADLRFEPESPTATATSPRPQREGVPSSFELEEGMMNLLAFIEQRGFVFEPWQVAAYVTAIRTKPFAILAGVSGTGKSKLPALVAAGTGAESYLVPVRPDWTDSADVLGYVDLQGSFRPGSILELLHRAMEEDDRLSVIIIDEMNLARVEQYFAEVLSKIEDRQPAPGGGYHSDPLVSQPLREEDREWTDVVIPSNVVLVGTVNMDETTHGFSRKVLDRAFTIELSDVDLMRWGPDHLPEPLEPTIWPLRVWQPQAITLSGLVGVDEAQRSAIDEAIKSLQEVNDCLGQAQLQVGYRTRDEVALFVVHAQQMSSAFVDRSGARVSPLDLALHMKVLPRIVGGSGAVRRALLQLLSWADTGQVATSEADAQTTVDRWVARGRPGGLTDARFPRTAGRLCLMWERLSSEGYTSFWL